MINWLGQIDQNRPRSEMLEKLKSNWKIIKAKIFGGQAYIRATYTLVANKCPVTYEQWSVYSSVSLGIRTKRTSHFRNELPEDRVPSKYSGNMLITSQSVSCGIAPVSTIATIASFPRGSPCLELLSRVLSCLFVPVFRLVLLLFRVSARNAMRRRLHSFSSSLKNRINPLTQRCFNQRNRVSRIQC